jgi:hypothetical protein
MVCDEHAPRSRDRITRHGSLGFVSTVSALLAEVTGHPVRFDAEVATSRHVSLDSFRRALRLLAFMGFAELVDRNDCGWAWESRQPSASSPRVAAIRAEIGQPLDAFLTSRTFLELEREMRAYELATGPDAPMS